MKRNTVITLVVLAAVTAAVVCALTFSCLWWLYNPGRSLGDPVYKEVTGTIEDVFCCQDQETVKFRFDDGRVITLKAPDFIQYLEETNQRAFWYNEQGKLIELTIRQDDTGDYLDSFILKPPPIDITKFTREELARAKRDQENALGLAAEAARKECSEQGIDPDSPEGEQFILIRVDEAIQAKPYPPR